MSRVPRRVAILDPEIDAVLSDLRPLRYTRGGSVSNPFGARDDDVPAHVRAASALRRQGARLVIVQDDVNVLALHDDASTAPCLLPLGPGGLRVFDDGRGNKHHKMDLEACAALPDGRLVAFGSGSAAHREQLVVVGTSGEPHIVDGAALYAMLRAEASFAGSELNIEGAIVVDEYLRLFQRGNGAPVSAASVAAGARAPLDATGDIDLGAFVSWLDGQHEPVPALERVVQYDLGQRGAARFTFTDATTLGDGRVAFLACAEASPDAVRDGEVLGARFGIIDGERVTMADIRDADGRATALKLEGIERRHGDGHAWSFDVVADVDRPDQPALLGRLTVRTGRS